MTIVLLVVVILLAIYDIALWRSIQGLQFEIHIRNMSLMMPVVTDAIRQLGLSFDEVADRFRLMFLPMRYHRAMYRDDFIAWCEEMREVYPSTMLWKQHLNEWSECESVQV